MAENLGDALLTLRTDDGTFSSDIDRARGQAERLGTTLDRTRTSSEGVGAGLRKAGSDAAAAGNAFQATSGKVTASAGAQRTGMMQLGQQINDIATMYALGARPAQIFSSQIGQVTQAIQLASGGSSKFAAFMGGPWGIALTAATVVLAPLVAKLFESEQAARAATLASDGLAEAQDVLGKMFDLTTGRIKAQNDMLRLNIQLQSMNMRNKAAEEKANADRVFNAARSTSASDSFFGGGISPTAAARAGVLPQTSVGQNNAARLGNLIARVRSGQTTAPDAFNEAKRLDFTGTGTTLLEFNQALANHVSSGLLESRANDIDESLKKGELVPSLRATPTGRSSGGRAGGSRGSGSTGSAGPTQAEIDARQASELNRLSQEELRARLELTTDAGERADIQKELLLAERDERVRKVEDDKQLSRAQKDAQIAAIERLYGRGKQTDAQGNTLVLGPPGLLAERINRDEDAQSASLRLDMLGRQKAALDAQASIATNLKDRNLLEQRALEIQQQIQRAMLEQEIANGRILDADLARALLAEQQRIEQGKLAQSQQRPLAAYVSRLDADKENLGAQVESLVVDELDYIHKSIADGIAGYLGVKDPLLRGLIEMFIQQVLIDPIARALQTASGSGGGDFFSALFSGIGAIFGGGRAIGGPVSAGTAYLVGENGPEIWTPPGNGTVIPNHRLAGAIGSGGTQIMVPVTIDATGADPAGLERVRQSVDQLRAELPARIITTVQDASDRRILSLRSR